jgi:hypothetical protein
MLDIDMGKYFAETGTILVKKEYFEYLKKKADAIDKIRAKIEEGAKIVQHVNIEKAKALYWCLDVIDKYTEFGEFDHLANGSVVAWTAPPDKYKESEE